MNAPLTAQSVAVRPRAAFSPVRPVRGALAAVLFAAGMPVWAQAAATDPGYEQPSWTGAVYDPAAARKEAAAALGEGRRECARQASGRAACLKQVEDDHKAAMQALSRPSAAKARAAKAAAKPTP